MLITNRHNLPAPLAAAVSTQRTHVPGRISVTELILPPQLRALSLKHADEIEEDAVDRLWAALGGTLHLLLKHYGREQRQFVAEGTVSTHVGGWTVTGTFDLYDTTNQTLCDYKLQSVAAAKRGVKPEHEQQLNLYAELMRRNGFKIHKLELVSILRDWVPYRADDPGYPPTPALVTPVSLWPAAGASRFLNQRVRLHQEAEQGRYPQCSAEERWEKPAQYALMRTGRKTAVKVFNSEQAALAACPDDNHYIQLRPGRNVRCESYCAVARWCKQRQQDSNGNEAT